MMLIIVCRLIVVKQLICWELFLPDEKKRYSKKVWEEG
jgi:hypothetical protein